jgi:hypothetical protein
MAPAQLGQAGGKVLNQPAEALVAEAAAGQPLAGADALQGAGGFGRCKALPFPHQGQHTHLKGSVPLLQGLDHLERDEIFPMPVAQDQQTGGHAVADTIRFREFAPPCGGMAKW